MRSPASGVRPQSVHWWRSRVSARRLLRSSWRSRSARSRGMASGFAGPLTAPSVKTCPDPWSKSRSTLGSARTDARRRRGRWRERGMESLMAGTLAGTGSFRCEECGYVVTLSASDTLPDCPGCGGSAFARASLFGATRFGRLTPEPAEVDDRDTWTARARGMAERAGAHLAYQDGDRLEVVPLVRE